MSDMQYVGWDLTYFDKGWCMIEGNAGGQLNVVQYATQIPLMDDLNDILVRI